VPVATLSREDVLLIHNHLAHEFVESGDPIFPAGVRSAALLDSAVGRQHSGFGMKLKYETPAENAATLLYGICMDHPFHNGNKRTALVSMLAHLDRNKLTLFGVRQKEIFDFMIDVASHGLVKTRGAARSDPDDEVHEIAVWIRRHADRVTRGEHPVTFRELRRILLSFGYVLSNPHGNSIDICKPGFEKKGFFRTAVRHVLRHITTIDYPGEGRTVPLRTIKFVRSTLKLREEDGIDSTAFYNDLAIVDAFVNEYRTVLRRLAHR
jgi:death-on-curing family protein